MRSGQIRTLGLLMLALAGAAAAAAQVPVNTAFTYQGELRSGGGLTTGVYDLRFSLHDALSGGVQIGTTLCLDNVTVTEGRFVVTLDFGAQFNGEQRFLQIAVKPGGAVGDCLGGTFTTLAPRQALTATPYALYALSGPGSGGPWAVNGNNISNTNTGNVGINTSSPTARLSIFGPENSTLGAGVLQLVSPGGTLGHVMTFDGNEINGWSDLHLNLDATTDIMMVEGGGNVGIGVAAPTFRLDVNGRVQVRQGSDSSAGIYFYQNTPAEDRGFVGMRNDTQIGLYGTEGAGWGLVMDVVNGRVGVNTTAPAAQFHVNGTARVSVLEITGADVAEKFPVSDEVKPGMVVMIDAENPGRLCLAHGAYNTRVAGIVSGANGLSAGTVLGHLPGCEDAPPIALSGRVWVNCDASAQAVEPGDFLTTSDTPGHAMKATDLPRAQGAVIGKAMSSLRKGETGLVLVLVNLQ